MPRLRLLAVAAAFAGIAGCDKASSETAAAAAPASQSAAPATPVSQRAAPIDLCGLVTEAEAESILGKQLAAPQKQRNGDCWYLREGGTDFGDVEFILSIVHAPVTSPAEFTAFVTDQVNKMNGRVKKSGLPAVFEVEPAPGVGAPAYFIDPGLYVLKGSRILAVALGGEKGVAVAKIALARMP